MIRATTPTLTLTVGDGSINLEEADNVYVALKQTGVTVELSGEELEISGNTVSCFLSQEKSLQLSDNALAKIQVNWTYQDASGEIKRAATLVRTINIGEQLIPRILE